MKKSKAVYAKNSALNHGKCHLKIYRARLGGSFLARIEPHLLAFYCDVEGHYHGQRHHHMTKLTEESIVVDIESLYTEMTKGKK